MVLRREPNTPALEDGSLGDSADRKSIVTTAMEGDNATDAAPQTDWLGMARNCYEDSTRYVDSSLRSQWERNERAFNNRHAPGSKYLSESYRHRTKLYRPKTRSMIRVGEAQAAASLFSNMDVINITAMNQSSPAAVASAELNKKLLQHRLTSSNKKVGIPWFLTCIGAFQDASKYGFVVSKQWWEYEEKVTKRYVPVYDELGQPMVDEEGRPHLEEQEDVKVLTDKPRCDLIPPENIRLDRGSDWRDPIGTSPYVIILHPMYVYEVEERAKIEDPKTGQPQWYSVDRSALKAATSRQAWDSTRTYREGNREDSKESETAIDEYTTVWVHENIMRWEGIDYVYFTAGTHELLSDPKPLTEVYRHCTDGERPLTLGNVLIETHKCFPAGKPELVAGLQQEANEVANLRIDNVKLALNKRWLVRRGRRVDLKSIVRNVPGSVTLTDSPEDDIKALETRDVTQSSYMEQDRINVDFDEIAGQFSAGTVQTNRRMNETVGGMELLSGSANMVSELDLRVFVETWCEPTLRQLVKLEQHYEDDITVLGIAGEEAQLHRYGVERINNEFIDRDVNVRVNVGVGATDPMQRIEKFKIAAEVLGSIFGEGLQSMLNHEEIIKEIMGPLGYADGSRFLNLDGPPPIVTELEAEIEELKRKLETKELERQGKIEVARMGALGRILAEAEKNSGSADAADVQMVRDLWMERMQQQGAIEMEQQRRITQAQGENRKGRNAAVIELAKGILQPKPQPQERQAANG